MNHLLISIVMPAYNCEKYLEQAVTSVQNQTYPNWELLIIDDCSSDTTRSLMKKMVSFDKRIRIFFNKKNMGAGQTRNFGVKKATGNWICFLDSDDLWHPEKLQEQLLLMEKEPNARLFFTASAFISENGDPIDYILHVPERISRKQLLKQNLISCSSVLIQKDLLLKYPMPGQKNIHEDFSVWLSVLSEEPYACGIDKPLLIYRKSQSSKSGNKWAAARMNWNTYRNAGLSFAESFYYMIWYTIKGILKYKNL